MDTRLDGGRGVVERSVELEPIPDYILRGGCEEDPVVHVESNRQHPCKQTRFTGRE